MIKGIVTNTGDEHPDYWHSEFPARVTSVVLGTGIYAGLWLYAWIEQMLDPSTGMLVNLPTGRYGNTSLTFLGVSDAAIVVSGTGYVSGDVLTVVGGTGTPATLLVTRVDGVGAIAGISVETPGNYSAFPANPVAVAGGAGAAATFNLTTGSIAAGDFAPAEEMNNVLVEVPKYVKMRYRGVISPALAFVFDHCCGTSPIISSSSGQSFSQGVCPWIKVMYDAILDLANCRLTNRYKWIRWDGSCVVETFTDPGD